MGDAQRRVEEASITDNGVAPSSTANDKIYEPKGQKKIIRVLTVVAYVFFVSLVAIMLSAYYVFLWNPNTPKRERLEYLVDPQGMNEHLLPVTGLDKHGGDPSFSSSLSHPANVQTSTDVPLEMPTFTSQEEDVDEEERMNSVDLVVNSDAGT